MKFLFLMRLTLAACILVSLLFIGSFSSANSFFNWKTPRLPAYQVDLSQTSVSGLSSGAFMATQFHVAFSSNIIGAGIIAGGPFYCAGSVPGVPFVETAMTLCMWPLLGASPDAGQLVQQAQRFAQFGDVDNLDHLKKSKVYLFSGAADVTVATKVVDQTAAFYRLAGVPEENIKYVNNVDAGHSIITDNADNNACEVTKPPYINNCHFMQSHDILRHIYGELNPPSSLLTGKLIKFNQNEFIPSSFSGMSDEAYLYAPKSCETEICRVHVVFHGCGQGANKIGDLFYRTTGYNELADSNHIIVLYPQVERSNGLFSPYNPKGCWDFWGYSRISFFSPDFYTKQATQMAAVKAMLDQLAKPRN
jgi:hypothetical protein